MPTTGACAMQGGLLIDTYWRSSASHKAYFGLTREHIFWAIPWGNLISHALCPFRELEGHQQAEVALRRKCHCSSSRPEGSKDEISACMQMGSKMLMSPCFCLVATLCLNISCCGFYLIIVFFLSITIFKIRDAVYLCLKAQRSVQILVRTCKLDIKVLWVAIISPC